MSNEFQCSCLGASQNFTNDGKPSAAEVEATIRTIIDWSNNQRREGLIKTPLGKHRAFEESSRRHAQDPAAILRKFLDNRRL